MPLVLSIATVVAALLLALGTNIVHRAGAQEATTPSPRSFEDFLRERLGEGGTTTSLPQDVLNKYLPSPTQADGPTALIQGIRPPTYPYSLPLSKLPTDGRTEQYVNDIKEFLHVRSIINQLEREYRASISPQNALSAVENPDEQKNYGAFAQSILALNGPIFWAPASKAKADDVVNQMGDEIRSVFGPIPAFDTSTVGKRTLQDGTTIETVQLYLEVDGNIVELKGNPAKPGSPLEYEHRSLDGQTVRWTPTIDRCDKPSLAGGVTPCGTSSRISRVTRRDSPVEWIALARKSKGVEKLDADPYWVSTDPTFALIGYIGFNPVTGEVAFVDGSSAPVPSEHVRFNWTKPIVPPGGKGYEDTQGRQEASSMYDDSFRIDCANCHDNREPIIMTPYMKHARVGYRNEKRREVASVGDFFPEKMRTTRKPYRVVGTGYTAVHARTLDSTMSIGHPSPAKTCTGCHGITNKGTGRFASDAVGRLGQLNPNNDGGVENNFRTTWAEHSGAGKIHPWMVPEDGQNISRTPPRNISNEEWELLKSAINDPLSVSGSRKIYTTTPAPESSWTPETLLDDPSEPRFHDPVLMPGDDEESVTISVRWSYHNSLGGVPTRDDVRFHLAIRDVALPTDGAEANEKDYPSIPATIAAEATRVPDEIYRKDDIVIVKNISFVDHLKWTDPDPTAAARQYEVRFPGEHGRRYLIRVLAKRFGFDRGGEVFSNVDHIFAVDVLPGR